MIYARALFIACSQYPKLLIDLESVMAKDKTITLDPAAEAVLKWVKIEVQAMIAFIGCGILFLFLSILRKPTNILRRSGQQVDEEDDEDRDEEVEIDT